MSAKIHLDQASLAILPGLMCDSRMFAAQLAAFPRALVVDGLYGGARRIEAMADYALARLPSRAILLGHSMGGRIALEVLRRAPDRLVGLILANTGVHPVQPGEAGKRHALLDLGRKDGMAALVAAWLPPMLAPARRADAALFASLEAMCVDAGLETYEAQVEALLARPDPTELLRDIVCPTLVITGSDDAWASPAQHEAIAAAIAGSRLTVIEGAGHMLPAEDPVHFNQAVSDFFGKANLSS